jgi:hypothetical protein
MGSALTRLIQIGTLAVASTTAFGTAAGVAGAATTSTGGAGSSGQTATTPTTLSGLKTVGTDDINDRVNALHDAIGRVDAAQGLGSGQATLDAYLGADVTPLQQLNTKIQGDTRYTQALTDFHDIFSNFRVYVLVLPAAIIAGDSFHATNTVIPNLQAASTKAQDYVNSNNQGVLQPLIDDLNAQIGTATSANNGLAATVLAFTPAQWNANQNLLAPARGQVQSSDAAIRKGRSDVLDIVQALRGSTNGTAGTSGGTGAHVGRLGRGGSATTTTS